MTDRTPKPLYYQPTLFRQFPGLVAGESTRHGGVSPAPYASLNLGLSTGDVLENVLENRRRFYHALGIEADQVANAHQVHDDRVLIADQPGRFDAYDALVTNKKGLFVAVSVADCTPILIYDPKNQAVAAVHAGWKGTAKEIVRKTLTVMHTQYGTIPTDCFAYIGTCIDECSFEVDEDVAVHFDTSFKRYDIPTNKYLIDLKKANAAQLLDAGVPLKQIEISPFSTVLHNADYFSFRKENRTTGRMMAVIGLLSIKN